MLTLRINQSGLITVDFVAYCNRPDLRDLVDGFKLPSMLISLEKIENARLDHFMKHTLAELRKLNPSHTIEFSPEFHEELAAFVFLRDTLKEAGRDGATITDMRAS
jgi:hypothetical protein